MTFDVFINKASSFLPFEAVNNEQIETVLGEVGGKPSRAKRIILRSNGIMTRHYAIDPTTKKVAFNNAQLTARAVEQLNPTTPVELLVTGTSTPDQLLPNHAVMVHGELKWPRLQAISTAGICLSGTTALKYAWLAVRSGDVSTAIATGSELVSPMLMAQHYEAEVAHKIKALATQPEIAFEKDFLRWMLSDGAGALLLSNQANPKGLSLKINWIELSSAAHELETCMYAGAEKDAQGELHGWREHSHAQWGEKSIFAIKQDVRLLNENVVRATFAEPLAHIAKKHQLHANTIDWFLPHVSSNYFVQPIAQAMIELGFVIPSERWFTNLTYCGNTGSASPFIMLEELFNSDRLKHGQKLLMFIPESGRFSSGFVHLEVVDANA